MAGRKFKAGRQPKRHRCKTPRGSGDRKPARGGRPPKFKRTGRQQKVVPECIDSTERVSLNELMQSITLPPHWTINTTTARGNAVINIGKVVSIPPDITLPTSTQPLIVTHCITVQSDLSWTAFVHGHCVKDQLSFVPKQLNHDTLISLVTKLDNYNVCPGHPDKHFVQMLSSRGGEISSRHGNNNVASLDTFAPVELNGEWYNQTVRSNACRIITNSTKCDKCVLYRDSLRNSYHHWNSKESIDQSTRISTTSATNFSLLTPPEKLQRYKQLKMRTTAAERKLKAVMKKLTNEEGIILENDLQRDISGIMEEVNSDIRKENSEGTFRRIFWEQQIEALKQTDKRQLRWHPAVIKWCLHVKYRSSSAYHAIRRTGVLTLPSERTLRDYTHYTKERCGFQKHINLELVKEANVMEEKDQYVVLLSDEMKIKEDLVFDKNSCELIGFVNLGDINNILDTIESRCNSAASEAQITPSDVATHMLMFMVRGIFTTLEFPYVCIPTRDTTGEELFPIMWEAVKNIEECGLKVIAITADGASPNRKFFQMHKKVGQKPGEVVYKTPNPYSSDNRDIYFMPDVPHLIKTTRNCWSNSFAHSNSRALWVSILYM